VAPTWLVFQDGPRRRWGGDLRRAFIFAELARRTRATVVESFNPRAIAEGLAAAAPRRFGFLSGPRPRVATSETLAWASLKELERRATPVALDIHDDPVAQASSLGEGVSAERLADLTRRMRSNLATFPILVVPSASFGDLAGVDPARRIVASNGTDTRHIQPEAFPVRPAIGFVSGAAAGRGIEALIDAASLVRLEVPELVLRLWLVATSDASARYLDGLRQATSDAAWIEIGEAPYDRLSSELARATVLAVPHPPGAYMDSALPVKLFDSLAAGRPVVVTPRTEAARVVRQSRAGIVAASDRVDDLAEALAAPFRDPALAIRLGLAARRAAVECYDWRLIGGRVAEAILDRG